MDVQKLMSMMGGDEMGMMANMLSKFTGSKMNREQISKHINNVYDKIEDGFISGMISMLYKEYPTESIGSLFKDTDDKQEKIKILSGLVTKSAPSVLEKMNETDLNRMYTILQKKRG